MNRALRLSLATGVPTRCLFGPTRDQETCRARFAVMLALRERGLSLPAIARRVNRKDHSTIRHGLQRAERLMRNPNFEQMVDRVREALAA